MANILAQNIKKFTKEFYKKTEDNYIDIGTTIGTISGCIGAVNMIYNSSKKNNMIWSGLHIVIDSTLGGICGYILSPFLLVFIQLIPIIIPSTICVIGYHKYVNNNEIIDIIDIMDVVDIMDNEEF